jgi:hypothetical protein
MPYTNNLNLPGPIAAAVENDPYDNGGADYSASGLTKPTRIAILTARHAGEIVEDVSDRIWALFGSAVHAILERSGEGGERELRLFGAISIKYSFLMRKEVVVSGATDYVEHVPGIGTRISDYKVVGEYTIRKTKENPTGVKFEWEAQQNIYAQLRRMNSLPVDALQIVAILRDWKESQTKNPEYHPHPVAVLPVPMWSPSRILGYMGERIEELEAVKVGGIPMPHCSPQERWGGRRCERYCPVKPFCIALNDGQVGPVPPKPEEFGV